MQYVYTFEDFEWLKELAIKHCECRESANHVQDMEMHFEYREPGYEGVPITGNWNKVSRYNRETKMCTDICATPVRMGNILEALGFEIEWDDEWTECQGCYGLVRTSPDGWGWKPSYYCSESEGVLCLPCIREDPDSYLEEILEGSRGVEIDLT